MAKFPPARRPSHRSSPSTGTGSCGWRSRPRGWRWPPRPSTSPQHARARAAGGGEAGRPRGVPGARPVGLLERGPVPAGRVARRVARGACRRSWRRAAHLPLVLAVGLPLRVDDRLFNCGVVVHRGRILGAVPKSYLPNYREFYEKRQFAPAAQALSTSLRLLGQDVPFGSRPAVRGDATCPGFVLHLELCEDLWVPLPPSTLARSPARRVLANLSASDITVGKADYRRLLCASQSAQCVAAYLYSAAGPGESTTDLAWDGHALVYENGERLAESQRFPLQPGIVTADIDLDHLRQERTRLTSFGDCVQAHAAAAARLPSHRVRTRRCRAAACRSSDVSNVSLTCRPTTRKLRRALRGGLRHPGRGADEAAHGHRAQQSGHRRSRAASTRRRRRWSPCGRSTGSGCRAPTSSATRCPASARVATPSQARTG